MSACALPAQCTRGEINGYHILHEYPADHKCTLNHCKLNNINQSLNSLHHPLLIVNIPTSLFITAKTLIDCGATTNFISKRYVYKHGIPTRKIKKTQIVKFANGTIETTNQIVTSLTMYINNQSIKENLIVFPLQSYDIILGMPFLIKYNPRIDWIDNTIEFPQNKIKSQINEVLETNVNTLEPAVEDVVVQQPSIAGENEKGLFANRAFKGPKKATKWHNKGKSGERIIEYTGKIIKYTNEEWMKLNKSYIDNKYVALLHKDTSSVTVIDATDSSNSSIARYCNRAIDSNKANAHLVKYRNKLYIYSIKPIEQGQEIIINYNRHHKVDGTQSQVTTIKEQREQRKNKKKERKVKKINEDEVITIDNIENERITYVEEHWKRRDINKLIKKGYQLNIIYIRPKGKADLLAQQTNIKTKSSVLRNYDELNSIAKSMINGDINKIENQEMKRLVEEFKDVFPEELPKGIPPERIIDHKINLEPNAKPPYKNYYRMSPKDNEEVKEHLTEMLNQGFIRESHSPYGAPVLFALKPGETKRRFCVDYRDLNKITIKDRYPIPRTEDLIEQLNGAKYFTKIDLRSGYFQVRIAEGDISKTAFVTRYGQFEFLVMPFGLTSAPATFVTIMNNIFKHYTDKFVVIYLDDILIYSKTKEEHIQHVRLVLERLRENKLYAKEKKCEFMQTSVKFVGFIVSDKGLEVDSVKVEAVKDWPTPRSIKEVRSFLGFVSYYRKFIENHSAIVAPISDLTKTKDKTSNKFTWTLEAQTAFEKMKQALMSAPILILPDPSKPYVINTDASGFAIGACIMQDHGKGLQPIAYMSKKLLPAEKNYPVHEKELLAIIVALKHWRHLVHGCECTVRVITDHKSITHLQTQPKLSERQVRWMEFIQEFGNQLKIEHQQGKTNIVADALSRRADHEEENEKLPLEIYNISVISSNIINLIKENYEKDNMTREMIKQGRRQLRNRSDNSVTVKDGIIYYNKTRLYVPKVESLITNIITNHHDNKTSGHFGNMKTIDLIERNYYWPNLRQDVKLYIKTCLTCQQIKPSNKKKQGLLQPLPIPQKKWHSVSMDFIVQLPKSKNGFDAIMVVCDRLSKGAVFTPMYTTNTAPEVAKLYFENVCRRYGFPKSIVSDRDSKFTSNFWKSLWSLFDTRLDMSTAFHPQTDGQTERTNRTLEQILRAFTNEEQDNWDILLPYIEISFNNSIQTSTGYSPFYVNHGQHMLLPNALIEEVEIENNNQTVEEMVTKMQSTLMKAQVNIKKAQERQKHYADLNRREEEYEIGDKVLLSTTDLTYTTGQKKLLNKQIGPYRIIDKINAVAYKLDLPPRLSRIHPVFHISKLLPYYSSDQFPSRPAQQDRPPPVMQIDGEDAYEVEYIVDKRKKRNKIEYLVKWKNYPSHENSWQPEQNLKQAREAIEEYEDSLL